VRTKNNGLLYFRAEGKRRHESKKTKFKKQRKNVKSGPIAVY